jgi:serine/threonine-protein kinase SRPK3
MKICEKDCASSARELAAYKHLGPITTDNIGALFIRDVYEDFKIQGLEGEHLCLIHEPLGFSLDTYRRLMPLKRFSEIQLKFVLTHLLQALDCLHRDAKMIHTGELYITRQTHRMTSLINTGTDVQAMNIHLRTEGDSIWECFEQGEMTNPSARKSNGPHVIYAERGLIVAEKQGRPVLCDFGEARFGQESYTDDIQPYPYRAPEVILKIPWSYGVDIWNVGVMASSC